jgi:hypothetical protein
VATLLGQIPATSPRVERVGDVKLAHNLLCGLLDSQFEKLLSDLDPKGSVGSARPGADPAEDRVRRIEDLIRLMIQRGPPSVEALQEAILAVRSPFSPFDGRTLENWVGRPLACWQATHSRIMGIGSDPLTFSDPDTPMDLQYASLLTWEGLPFRDGIITARVSVPFIGGSGAGGLVLRNVHDRSALIGLLRQAQPDQPRLELWHQVGTRLWRLQSVSCPPVILTEDSCWLTLQVRQASASVNVTSDSHPNEASASLNTLVPADHSPGYFGFIKFGSSTAIFTDLRLTVDKRSNGFR